MKAFQKLALVSAIAMSSSVFALEAADDATLSAATGQDGITILIAPGDRTAAQLTGLGVSAGTIAAIDLTNHGVVGADNVLNGLSIGQVIVHDDDGVASAGTTENSGALVIGSGGADSTVLFADNNIPIQVDIDMVGSVSGTVAGSDSMLNVTITTPVLAIKTGNIYVANSNAADALLDKDGGVVANANDTDGTSLDGSTPIAIMNGMEIILGATSLNVQLGTEAQGAMVLMNAALVGGLTINNMQVNDATAVTGGSFRASSMTVKNSGSADLNAVVAVNITNTIGGADTFGGLVVTVAALGDGGGANIAINDIELGSATSPVMGDVQMNGLNVNGTKLIIRGH